jgi:multicomponent Na+:H+ antiporter subunit D
MLVALATAILTLLVREYGRAQRAVSTAGVLAYAGTVALLVAAVVPGTIIVYELGNWPAPYGIVLVADSLSAFMLALTAALAVPALAFSLRSVDDFGQRLSYHPLFHFMLLGVTGAFLTGDIFNLFVWFEVMLMASYVLVVFHGGERQTAAALRYVVLNLVGSAVMLLAIGGLYAVTGTLNMADISRYVASAPPDAIAPILGLSALLFAVFALKAGMVPLHFWVPGAYVAAPAPVTAMLAGVVKKVGVYAIVRLSFTVFAAAGFSVSLPGLVGDDLLAFYGAVLFLMAAASTFFGGFGAVGQDELDGMLAYSSIGQVGFIALPLAVGAAVPAVRALAITAALVYALNHTLSKGLLFLVAGTIEDATGSTRFADLGGLAGRNPVLAGTFLIGGFGLVGIPPLAGFFGKLLVFQTAIAAGGWLALGVALAGAILTIAYVTRAWNRGFWGTVSPAVEASQTDPATLVVLVALAAAVVGVGVGFDPVFQFADAAAEAALAREDYVTAVLGSGGESA